MLDCLAPQTVRVAGGIYKMSFRQSTADQPVDLPDNEDVQKVDPIAAQAMQKVLSAYMEDEDAESDESSVAADEKDIQEANDAEIAAAMELEEQEHEATDEACEESHSDDESDIDEDMRMFKDALKTAGKTAPGFFNELGFLACGSTWGSVMWEPCGSQGTTVVVRVGDTCKRMSAERTEEVGLPAGMPAGSRVVKREIIGTDGAVTLRYRAYLNHPMVKAVRGTGSFTSTGGDEAKEKCIQWLRETDELMRLWVLSTCPL
ncbi:unnamed protein product [Prorocentrum cordatum]|uniref:FACT complex subunit n=1 Tax=Prorocentrum cordatum TaxID=2364126 RepID=A0ABN9TYD3_9DINO|nr:unnamed protein product [Polarella glacialis]